MDHRERLSRGDGRGGGRYVSCEVAFGKEKLVIVAVAIGHLFVRLILELSNEESFFSFSFLFNVAVTFNCVNFEGDGFARTSLVHFLAFDL